MYVAKLLNNGLDAKLLTKAAVFSDIFVKTEALLS